MGPSTQLLLAGLALLVGLASCTDGTQCNELICNLEVQQGRCPDPRINSLWKWNQGANAYLYIGTSSPRCRAWTDTGIIPAGCSQCHGACCLDDGSCPSNVCSINELAKGPTDAKICYQDWIGVDGGFVESAHGDSCPVGDTDQETFWAFCDLSAYGGNVCEGSDWKQNYLCTAGSAGECENTVDLYAESGSSAPWKGHCLGRVACRNPNTGAVAPCDGAIKAYEGVDCFQDSGARQWRLCFDCSQCLGGKFEGCKNKGKNKQIIIKKKSPKFPSPPSPPPPSPPSPPAPSPPYPPSPPSPSPPYPPSPPSPSPPEPPSPSPPLPPSPSPPEPPSPSPPEPPSPSPPEPPSPSPPEPPSPSPPEPPSPSPPEPPSPSPPEPPSPSPPEPPSPSPPLPPSPSPPEPPSPSPPLPPSPSPPQPPSPSPPSPPPAPFFVCPGATIQDNRFCVDANPACRPPNIPTAADNCQSNCGNNCNLLCTTLCGATQAGPSDCNNVGGSNCMDLFPGNVFTGPCCVCNLCPVSTP